MSTEVIPSQNDQLVLICGESGTGKSAALRNIEKQDDWLYLNTEAGKRLPFRNKFRATTIENPWQVHQAFDYACTADGKDVVGIIIDSATFMMDMVETQIVLTSATTQKAWGDFAQFFKVLMQEKVAKFAKPTIITAHTLRTLDEGKGEWSVNVPVKGALKNNGIEAYFSTVVATKKVKVKDLEKYSNELLHISDEERELGFKHVFQTRITKETTGERIRSPMGMFSKEETFIDNDAQLLLNHLNQYYHGK